MIETNQAPRVIGYIRTSKADRVNEPMQLDGLALSAVFTDHVGPKAKRRPERTRLLAELQAGDTLVVENTHRLAGDIDELCGLIRQLTAKGCAVQFLAEDLCFDPAMPDAVEAVLRFLVLGAGFVTSVNAERQREGIASARKSTVKYVGRKPTLTAAKAEQLTKAANAPKANIADLARKLGVTRATVYRYKNQPIPNDALAAEDAAIQKLKKAKQALRTATGQRLAATKKLKAQAAQPVESSGETSAEQVKAKEAL